MNAVKRGEEMSEGKGRYPVVFDFSSGPPVYGSRIFPLPDNSCGVAFPMEWMCVATYLLNAESINACRCGVANKSRMI